jgi:hypothetical protein
VIAGARHGRGRYSRARARARALFAFAMSARIGYPFEELERAYLTASETDLAWGLPGVRARGVPYLRGIERRVPRDLARRGRILHRDGGGYRALLRLRRRLRVLHATRVQPESRRNTGLLTSRHRRQRARRRPLPPRLLDLVGLRGGAHLRDDVVLRLHRLQRRRSGAKDLLCEPGLPGRVKRCRWPVVSQVRAGRSLTLPDARRRAQRSERASFRARGLRAGERLTCHDSAVTASRRLY